MPRESPSPSLFPQKSIQIKQFNTSRFLDDLTYWGSEYEVTSPDDPIVLVDQTCVTYSKDNPLRKRDSADSLVENSSGPGCFGGLVECSVDTGVGNSTCTLDNNSGSESHSSSPSKRAPQCYNLPALFYNCDLFGAASVENRNQNTMQNQPHVGFIG